MIVPICPLNDDNIDFLTGIISYLDYTHFPFPSLPLYVVVMRSER